MGGFRIVMLKEFSAVRLVQSAQGGVDHHREDMAAGSGKAPDDGSRDDLLLTCGHLLPEHGGTGRIFQMNLEGLGVDGELLDEGEFP